MESEGRWLPRDQAPNFDGPGFYVEDSIDGFDCVEWCSDARDMHRACVLTFKHAWFWSVPADRGDPKPDLPNWSDGKSVEGYWLPPGMLPTWKGPAWTVYTMDDGSFFGPHYTRVSGREKSKRRARYWSVPANAPPLPTDPPPIGKVKA